MTKGIHETPYHDVSIRYHYGLGEWVINLFSMSGKRVTHSIDYCPFCAKDLATERF